METKECGFSGFKMNWLFGLVPSFGSAYGSDNLWVYHFCAYLDLSVCLCLIWFIMFVRLYGAGAERGACYGVLW